MFSLFLALEKRWWLLFWILAICILGVREDSGVMLFGVGVYMVLSQRFPKAGLGVCVLSFGYIVLLTNVIMPLFSADISERFMMERFGQYAEGEDASTLEILWGIVSNPWRLIAEIFTPFFGTLKYLLGQWLPLAFIPAIAPASWMIAGFPLLKLFIAKGQSVLAINIRYAMTVVPGLFYGTILWWGQKHFAVRSSQFAVGEEEIGDRRQETEDRSQQIGDGRQEIGDKIQEIGLINFKSQIPNPKSQIPNPKSLFSSSFRRFWIGCIGLSLFFTFTSNPNRTLSFIIPDAINPWVYVPLTQQWSHAGQIKPLLAQIPADASVAATTYLVPHLSSRRQILRFPLYQLRNDTQEVVSVEYIIADLWQLQQYQAAFASDRDNLREIMQRIEQFTATGEYGIIGFNEGVILMKKGAASDAEAIAAWQRFRSSL